MAVKIYVMLRMSVFCFLSNNVLPCKRVLFSCRVIQATQEVVSSSLNVEQWQRKWNGFDIKTTATNFK